MADETVKVTLTLDSKQYQQMMKSASKHTDAVDDSIKKTQKSAGKAKSDWGAMGAAITVAGGAAVIALKKAVDAASDLNESTTKMRTIFGKASGDIEKFASTSASSLGMSKRAAMDAASMMATFGKAAGLAGGDLTKFSTEMVTLSGDLASFFNSSPEEAMDAIGAALRGEAEPIRRYGVLLDDATLKNRAMEMGIISSTKNALTPQQKALAAQKEILAQTSDAQGDFANTSDGLANSQRQMSAAMEDAQASLGDALLPVMTKGVKAVGGFADAFSHLPGPIRDTVAGATAVAAGAALIGPAMFKAGKNVKDMTAKLKELAVVQKATNAASGAGGIKGMAASAAGAAGPITALVAAIGSMVFIAEQMRNAQMAGQMDEITKAMDDAAIAGRSLDSALDFDLKLPGTRAETGMGIDQQINGVVELMAAWEQGGVVAGKTEPSFRALDAQLSKMNPAAASAAYDDLAAKVEASGGSVEDLNANLPDYIAKEKDAARAAAEQAGTEEGKAEALKKANDAQQEAIDLVSGYINAQLAASGAADYLLGAEERLTKAHKENGDSLSNKTSKGRANREALRDETAAVLANRDAVIESAKVQGKGVEAYILASEALKKTKKGLEDAAVAAGYSKGEVKKYIAELTNVDDNVTTQIDLLGVNQAKDYLADLRARIKDLPTRVVIAVQMGSVAEARRNAGIPGLATGGKVAGPGTATSDGAGLYALSNGEWVVPAASARKVGDRYMEDLVAGDVGAMATGGKVTKKPLTPAQKKAAAKKASNAKKAKAKKAAQAAADRRQAILDDINWQYDMDMISLPQKIAKEQKQLKNLKPGSEEYKDLQLTIHRDQKEYQSDQESDAADAAEEAAKAQEEAADALQKAAEDQKAAAAQLKDKADGIAKSIVSALSISSTQANGKKWNATAILGDSSRRAQQARDFATLVSDLASRGLSEEIINQVLSMGPVAGADLARALASMDAGQIAQVNADQTAIGASGQWSGNALTYGNNSTFTVELSGGAPVVLQLDSRAIYEGQLTLQRQMGGSYALAGR